MAELVLCALLPVVFEKLTSVLESKITRSKGIHSELKRWERKLFLIQAFLEDASQKEVTSKAVKQWLNDLQHLAYDIDDILDALATDAMHREFVNESQPITNKVRKFIPSFCTSFSLSARVGNKLDNISTRLQELMDEKDKLGLSVKNEGSKDTNRRYQTSLIDAPSIVGREGDKKELVQKLLSDESCNKNFSIVPIVGMGGIGKTTLAKLVYDDQLVKDHFELKAWVCVSDDFDSFKISKVIYQSVGGEQKDFIDLNLLQVALRDRLMGKRFLLVLDDVWSDKLEDWETLAGPFFSGAPGSKIIITTRKQQLLHKLGYDHPYDLKKLLHDDALSLFAQHSLGVKSFDLHPVLRPHGEGIVQKCDGLPLALKALGSLLRTKTNEEEWKQLLNNEIWMLKDGGDIVPALRLSYHDLSAPLKDLAIVSYGGKLFPNWIGDPSFLSLTNVRIEKCRNCMFLPPLGELPSLKKLDIQELNEVKVVGSEFLGTGIAFPKLESLRITNMRGWEVWSTKSGVVGAVFPCLQELEILYCPNLVKVSLEALPSLRVLHLNSCGDGVLTSLIHAASSVTKLIIHGISGLSDEVWRGVMDSLGAVEELCIGWCNEIRYLWESEAKASKVLVNLRKLEVWDCSKLVSLGEQEEEEDGCNQLTSLRILGLDGCQNLERCNLPNNIIQELNITCCDSIASVSFLTGGHKLKSLRIDNCEQLLEKEVLLNTSMPLMLEVVHIERWKNLKSINELTCFIHITELEISDCSSIGSFPASDLPNLTSLKRLRIVKCKSMDVDSFGVWPPKLAFLEIGGLKKPISKFGPQTFPSSLVNLQLWGGSAEEDDVTSGSQLSHMVPSSLTTLWLFEFEKMESFSKGLQHLTSLQRLTIWSCPKMKDLPEMLLPSLSSLRISGCTDELKEKTSKRGSYWPVISYIPYVYID